MAETDGSEDGCPDAVIVLGAAVLAPGVPSQALRRRIEHGVTVFFARRARYLVVSGGLVNAPPAEAELMQAIALDRGVPAERIIVEDVARNTFENAVYTGFIFRREGWRSAVVVTDGFHLPRALFCFHRLGLPVVGDGVPRRCDISRLAWCQQYADEMVRLVRCAGLFLIGSHKPVLERVWGR